MVCSTRVFDDVGVTAGRGVGGRVSCPRPLPWRYPSGFAGMCFATVSGLGVWWTVCCLLVVALWPLRSEEHTSELQSRFDLVCRLLLEKKKKHSHMYLVDT